MKNDTDKEVKKMIEIYKIKMECIIQPYLQ